MVRHHKSQKPTNRGFKSFSGKTLLSMTKSETPKKTLDSLPGKCPNSKMNSRLFVTKTMNTKSASMTTKFPSSELTLKVRTKSQSFHNNASASMLWSRSATAKSRLWEEKFRSTSRDSAFPQPNCPRWERRWATSRTDSGQLPNSLRLTNSASKNCFLRTPPWETKCELPNKTYACQLVRSEDSLLSTKPWWPKLKTSRRE